MFDYLHACEPGALINLGVHSHFGGRPAMTAIFRQILEYFRSQKDVWFAHHHEVAKWMTEQRHREHELRKPLRKCRQRETTKRERRCSRCSRRVLALLAFGRECAELIPDEPRSAFIVNSAPGGGTDILARVIAAAAFQATDRTSSSRTRAARRQIGIEAVAQRPRRRLHAAADAEHADRDTRRSHKKARYDAVKDFVRDHAGRRHLQCSGRASRRAGQDAGTS